MFRLGIVRGQIFLGPEDEIGYYGDDEGTLYKECCLKVGHLGYVTQW